MENQVQQSTKQSTGTRIIIGVFVVFLAGLLVGYALTFSRSKKEATNTPTTTQPTAEKQAEETVPAITHDEFVTEMAARASRQPQAPAGAELGPENGQQLRATAERDATYSRDGCFEIVQFHFDDYDAQGRDMILDYTYDPCYILSDNDGQMQFNHMIIVTGGTPPTNYFDGNTIALLPRNGSAGPTGIKVQNGALAKNLDVRSRLNGVWIETNASVETSRASLNNSAGFKVLATGTVRSSTATQNNQGFWLEGGNATDCTAPGNYGYGVYINGAGTATNCRADNTGTHYNTDYNFRLHNGGTVVNGTSIDATFAGFWLDGGGEVRDSLAESNDQVGFDIGANGVVRNSDSNGNHQVGYHLFGAGAQLIDSASDYNYRDGVYATAGTITNFSARRDGTQQPSTSWYGVELAGTATATNVTADNNNNGVKISSGASLGTGIQMCGNERNSVVLNGGSISGAYLVSSQPTGTGTCTATFTGCSGGTFTCPQQGGGSPSLLKEDLESLDASVGGDGY